MIKFPCILRVIWQIFKGMMFGIGITTTLIAIGYLTYPVKQPRNEIVVMLTQELEHRVNICNQMIDLMGPETDPATFDCAMMWQQETTLETFMKTNNLRDNDAVSAMTAAFNTGQRYAEYQQALNSPEFHVAPFNK